MAEQLHKRFDDGAVKSLLRRYLAKEISGKHVQRILDIKERRFYKLAKEYKANPDNFTIQYSREKSTRKISGAIEKIILDEFKTEKKLIEDPETTLRHYNYTYIKEQIYNKYQQRVSVPTIIDRAKKNDFYIPRKKRKKTHDREILTNYVGELIQHDSSFHKWAPYSDEKWYLVTSLDDHSRMMLYAQFLKKDTSWDHILAARDVFMTYGVPYRYYVDSHSIFRFVQGRDSVWRNHKKVTDMAPTQWQQVLYDCNVEITHSLSPQAHGKVERPYGWMQDRIVRTCAREDVRDIEGGREILNREVDRYNYHQLHSTTGEIPWIRFRNAQRAKKSLFREFSIKPPYQSSKDIFCLRDNRTSDKYAEISFKNMRFKMPRSTIGQKVELRISPDLKSGMAEVRFWHQDGFLGAKNVKNEDLNLLHF